MSCFEIRCLPVEVSVRRFDRGRDRVGAEVIPDDVLKAFAVAFHPRTVPVLAKNRLKHIL